MDLFLIILCKNAFPALRYKQSLAIVSNPKLLLRLFLDFFRNTQVDSILKLLR